jgi:hypothetical protein
MAQYIRAPRQKSIDAFLTFANARGYHLASRVINDQPQKSILFWPLMVTEAFSLELHIKALHRLRRRVVHGHIMPKLYEQLSKRDKQRIDSYLSGMLAAHPFFSRAVNSGVSFSVDASSSGQVICSFAVAIGTSDFCPPLTPTATSRTLGLAHSAMPSPS